MIFPIRLEFCIVTWHSFIKVLSFTLQKKLLFFPNQTNISDFFILDIPMCAAVYSALSFLGKRGQKGIHYVPLHCSVPVTVLVLSHSY